MKYGLVGNTILYTGVSIVGIYMIWELKEMSKNMLKYDDDHPVNEVFNSQNRKKFIDKQKLEIKQEKMKLKTKSSFKNEKEIADADI